LRQCNATGIHSIEKKDLQKKKSSNEVQKKNEGAAD
jgi:hypothetical protein